MCVFVIGQTGKRLMPTTSKKARKLLSNKKAVVYQKIPFTIKLTYKTGGSTQPLLMGIDTGSQKIGISIVNKTGKVLNKTEVELRSTMEKRSLLESRKTYRRGRRYRKVRFRHPKWKHHTKRTYNKISKKGKHWIKAKTVFKSNKKDGWLPPSIECKINHHFNIIDKFLNALPKETKLAIEVGRFDIARMQDPSIHNELYQKGPMYDYENRKAYVFARDDYKCQCCKTKGGTKRKDGSIVKLIMHHVQYKSKGATDNPKYLVTVCDKCHTHENHKSGGILYKWMDKNKSFNRGYRDATFMNILRKSMFAKYPYAKFTYGNITAADRKALYLDKGHANDAIAIALLDNDIDTITNNNKTILIKQVRTKKRSLHEATPRKGRKEPNRLAKRNSKNTKAVGSFKIWDTVIIENKIRGYISGFTGNSAYIHDFRGNYIIPKGKTYKQHSLSSLQKQKNNNGWLITSA